MTTMPPPTDSGLWQPDAAAPECNDCHDKFSLFNRRHHCRACGSVFCKKCSVVRAPRTAKSKALAEKRRLCDPCVKTIEEDAAAEKQRLKDERDAAEAQRAEDDRRRAEEQAKADEAANAANTAQEAAAKPDPKAICEEAADKLLDVEKAKPLWRAVLQTQSFREQESSDEPDDNPCLGALAHWAYTDVAEQFTPEVSVPDELFVLQRGCNFMPRGLENGLLIPSDTDQSHMTST